MIKVRDIFSLISMEITQRVEIVENGEIKVKGSDNDCIRWALNNRKMDERVLATNFQPSEPFVRITI